MLVTENTYLVAPEVQKILENILLNNILPFWYPQVIDLDDGGYRLNHDIHGNWQGKSDKFLVTQARTLWFFSRLVNSSYANSKYLEAAKHGYEFLSQRMWDQKFGGFYWRIDSSGVNIKVSNKDMYGQAFGLYAISEYAIASGDSSARVLANKLFELWEDYAYDGEHGGYLEIFGEDWQTLPPEKYTKTQSLGRLTTTNKTMNTHLHLMEAITLYSKIADNSLVKEKLLELICIENTTVLRKNLGACTDEYDRHWNNLHGINYEVISYGHNLENIWLLIEACQTINLSVNLFRDFLETVFQYSLNYGYDNQKGGFYNCGFYNQSAHKQEKIWWVQAEALVAALSMYQITRKEIYYNCFCKTLDWIRKYQVDWENGEWYDKILPQGTKTGAKAGAWKSAYHNGRAMLQCLNILSLLK